jgi:hypothetical protein
VSDECEVCGRPGHEALIFAVTGHGVDAGGGIWGVSVSRFAVLCGRPECQTKAEDLLRGGPAPPRAKLDPASERWLEEFKRQHCK